MAKYRGNRKNRNATFFRSEEVICEKTNMLAFLLLFSSKETTSFSLPRKDGSIETLEVDILNIFKALS
jgi:hypothetical protein